MAKFESHCCTSWLSQLPGKYIFFSERSPDESLHLSGPASRCPTPPPTPARSTSFLFISSPHSTTSPSVPVPSFSLTSHAGVWTRWLQGSWTTSTFTWTDLCKVLCFTNYMASPFILCYFILLRAQIRWITNVLLRKPSPLLEKIWAMYSIYKHTYTYLIFI